MNYFILTKLEYGTQNYDIFPLVQKMAKQNFSFERLSINIPSCLYQNESYYHDGKFVDDKYRRPWTRGRSMITFRRFIYIFKILNSECRMKKEGFEDLAEWQMSVTNLAYEIDKQNFLDSLQ